MRQRDRDRHRRVGLLLLAAFWAIVTLAVCWLAPRIPL